MEEIKQQIAPLQRELDKLLAKNAALNAYLEADEEIETTDALIAEHIVDRRNPAELIENILRRAGRPLHYKEILIRLKTEENFDMPGKDPSANLTARLSINPQFVRVEKGTYTLRELLTGAVTSLEEVKGERHVSHEEYDNEGERGESTLFLAEKPETIAADTSDV
jgi:hypothetical protein